MYLIYIFCNILIPMIYFQFDVAFPRKVSFFRWSEFNVFRSFCEYSFFYVAFLDGNPTVHQSIFNLFLFLEFSNTDDNFKLQIWCSSFKESVSFLDGQNSSCQTKSLTTKPRKRSLSTYIIICLGQCLKSIKKRY